MKNLIIAFLSVVSVVLTCFIIWLSMCNVELELERDAALRQRNAALRQRPVVLVIQQSTNETPVVETPEEPEELEIEEEALDTQCDEALIYDLALEDDLQLFTYSMCEEYGIVDYYELVLAVMWKESEFNADAISATGDYGLMQINKCNHKHLQEVLGVTDMLDPEQNIRSGVYMLSGLLNKYQNVDSALMAYNMGPGGANKALSRGTTSTQYTRDVQDRLALIKLQK